MFIRFKYRLPFHRCDQVRSEGVCRLLLRAPALQVGLKDGQEVERGRLLLCLCVWEGGKKVAEGMLLVYIVIICICSHKIIT